MRRREILHCERCLKFWTHSPEGDTAAKCDHCGKIRDASFEFGGLSLIQAERCIYHRWRYATGLLTEPLDETTAAAKLPGVFS